MPGPKNVPQSHGAVIMLTNTAVSNVVVASAPASEERVWVSINPLVCIYPWLGTSIAPGATATIAVSPGVPVYSSSPMGTAQLTVTVN